MRGIVEQSFRHRIDDGGFGHPPGLVYQHQQGHGTRDLLRERRFRIVGIECAPELRIDVQVLRRVVDQVRNFRQCRYREAYIFYRRRWLGIRLFGKAGDHLPGKGHGIVRCYRQRGWNAFPPGGNRSGFGGHQPGVDRARLAGRGNSGPQDQAMDQENMQRCREHDRNHQAAFGHRVSREILPDSAHRQPPQRTSRTSILGNSGADWDAQAASPGLAAGLA